jgi:hypothetical protein
VSVTGVFAPHALGNLQAPQTQVAVNSEMSVGETSLGVVAPAHEVLRGESPALRARRAWLRRPLTERLGWAALAGLLLGTLVLSSSAAQTDQLLPQSVRPVPSGLAGPLGQHGIDLGLGGLIAVLALMFAAYVLALRAADTLRLRAILIAIGAMHAIVLLGPPLLSTDVFSYIAYGRIGRLYASNPYLVGPSAIQLDHVYPFIDAQWVNTPTVYGPVFTALSCLLAPLTIAANVLVYKALAAVSSLAVVLMVWKAAPLRGVRAVRAVALVGLNPVTVLYGVGGGHNDLLMLAILTGGIYVLLLGRERAGGALVVVAAAVKLTGGLLAPFALARDRGAAGGHRALLTGLSLAAGVAAAFSCGLFGAGPLHLLGTLQSVQSEGGIHSVPGLILHLLGVPGLGPAVGLALDAGYVIAVVVLVRRVWRGELDWIVAVGWATVGLLLTAEMLLPWYIVWLMPLAALCRDRRLLIAAVLLTALGLTTL